MKDDLTVEQVKEWLDYNPETGDLTWKVKVNRNTIIGSSASSYDTKGYIRVGLNGKSYKGHRLAWVIYYGEWPTDQIDHRNQKRDDNRISNLRLASASENAKNQKTPKNNSTGVKGVYFLPRTHSWRASITVNRKVIILGCFPDKDSAIRIRQLAEDRHGFTRSS